MEELIVNIGASSDCFGAYSENCEGIYASGNSVEECKKDVLTAIKLIKETLPEEQWPDIIKKDFKIIWHYDIQSLLMYYGSLMSIAGIERITGINQKQLWHYASGNRNPRPEQKIKIETALHKLGEDLLSINL